MAEKLKDSAVPQEALHLSAIPMVAGVLVGDGRYSTWRSQGTQDYLLMYTQEGCGRVGYRGGELLVPPGELVLIRPGVRHDYGTARGAGSWRLIWTHFQPRPHWLEWLHWPEPAVGIYHLALTGEVRENVEQALLLMDTRARSALPRREQFALHALEEALLWCASSLSSAQARDARVLAAMTFLIENLVQPLTLADVASAAELSVSRLSHRFKEEVGITPWQFLERERLSRAAQLLGLTTRPISAIAEEVGFASAIHFSLRFRKAFGLSPRDYRKREGLEGG